MTPPSSNPALAARSWRAARRLFGARADDYEISPDWPALLVAKAIREDQQLPEGDCVLVAVDVIEGADPAAVLAMLRGEGDYLASRDPVEAATGDGRR